MTAADKRWRAEAAKELAKSLISNWHNIERKMSIAQYAVLITDELIEELGKWPAGKGRDAG